MPEFSFEGYFFDALFNPSMKTDGLIIWFEYT